MHDKSDNTGKKGKKYQQREKAVIDILVLQFEKRFRLEKPQSTARDNSLLQSKTHDFRCYRFLYSRGLTQKRATEREREEEKEQAQWRRDKRPIHEDCAFDMKKP